MDIDAIVKRARQIIWRHKVLWLFAFLSSCGQNGLDIDNVRSLGELPDPVFRNFPRLSEMIDRIPENTSPDIIWFFIVSILALMVVFFLLDSFSQVGMVRGIVNADAGEDHLTFK